MARNDGSITFSTSLDNKQLEKDLAKINREIEKSEKTIYEKEAKKSPLVEQAEDLQRKISEARAEVKRYAKEWVDGVIGADQNQSVANSRLRDAQAEYENILAKIQKIDDSISPAKEKLEEMKEKAGGLQKELASVTAESSRMGEAVDVAGKYLDKFTNRLKQMARRVFVFTVITGALRSVKDWMWSVIKTNDEAVAAIAKLKGALLTAAQPLVEVVIPAFVALVNIMTRIVAVAAQLVAYLFGKTASESKKAAEALNKEKEALEGVGGAADKASGSLAGFDEINTIRTEDNTDAMNGIVPDFSFETNMMEEQMENLLGWIEAIGAGLAAWKIGSMFKMSLIETMGLAMGIYSAFQFVKEITDAWANGVTWDNLLTMLIALAGAATGFGIAFGTVGAGITLIIGGLAMLVTGFHDAYENGWNFYNLLMSVSGMFAAGVGIAVLTGSWIPILVAAIAGLLLEFAVATGHGDELVAGLRKTLEGFVEFFAGIFSGDLERALGGIEKIFDGLGEAVGAVIDGVRDTFLSFLDWLDEKTGGKLKGIIDFVKKLVVGVCDTTKELWTNTLNAAKNIFKGFITFLTGVFTHDWDRAWSGIQQIFQSIWDGIVGIVEIARTRILGIVEFVIGKISNVIKAVKDLLGVSGKEINVVGGGMFGGEVSLGRSIPALATGTVVPPNRQFMAILGDNKHETEVVSPLSTMKQALMEALQESGGIGGGAVTVVVNLDGKEVARNTVKHVNDMTRQAGKPVLLF